MEEIYWSEWADWKKNKVTQFIIKALKDNRLDRLNDIGDGKVFGDDLYLEIGRTQGIQDSVNFVLEEIKEFLIKDEEER